MEAHNSHSKSLSCTVPSGDNRRDVSRSITSIVTLGARFPPSDLARVPLNTEPTLCEELDVISSASKVAGNVSIERLQSRFALRRADIFLALVRASALLLAPHA